MKINNPFGPLNIKWNNKTKAALITFGIVAGVVLFVVGFVTHPIMVAIIFTAVWASALIYHLYKSILDSCNDNGSS